MTEEEWLSETEFKTLVPGHGAPMSRREFGTYRKAFDNLLACAEGDAAKSACIDGWLADAGDLVPDGDRELARSLLDYYLDTALRAGPERAAKYCEGGTGTVKASGVAQVVPPPL